MLKLHALKKLHKSRKRVGRGGDRGGTSGRGYKGQKCRSGAQGELRATFEGGQMPLHRRIPRRGFNNIFKTNVCIVNIRDLEKHCNAGETVTAQLLIERRVIKPGNKSFIVKVLGVGALTKLLNVQVDAISAGAKQQIEKAGGSVVRSGSLSGDRTVS